MFAPPQFLLDVLPKDIADWLVGWGWGAILASVGLVILAVAVKMIRGLFRRPPPAETKSNLSEVLADYPPAPAAAGELRLQVEKSSARLRLVVLAPVGEQSVSVNEAEDLLDQLVPQLGDIARQDRPRVKIWPKQLSASGFAQQLHTKIEIPEAAGELSRWVVVAGRAKIDGRALMIGLALQTNKPTPIGHKTVDAHEWTTLIRVRS